MTDMNDQLFDFWEADTLNVGHLEGRTLLSIKAYNFDMTDKNHPLSVFWEADTLKVGHFEGRTLLSIKGWLQFRYDGHE